MVPCGGLPKCKRASPSTPNRAAHPSQLSSPSKISVPPWRVCALVQQVTHSGHCQVAFCPCQQPRSSLPRSFPLPSTPAVAPAVAVPVAVPAGRAASGPPALPTPAAARGAAPARVAHWPGRVTCPCHAARAGWGSAAAADSLAAVGRASVRSGLARRVSRVASRGAAVAAAQAGRQVGQRGRASPRPASSRPPPTQRCLVPPPRGCSFSPGTERRCGGCLALGAVSAVRE